MACQIRPGPRTRPALLDEIFKNLSPSLLMEEALPQDCSSLEKTEIIWRLCLLNLSSPEVASSTET